MNQNEIIELIRFFEASSLEVMELNQGDIRLYLKKAAPCLSLAQPSSTQPEFSPAIPENSDFHKIISPMVGTFYRAANPESKPFVEIGQIVKKGDVLCIIEAMKMLNEIQADCDGKIIDILVENASMVDYGKTLFLIEENHV